MYGGGECSLSIASFETGNCDNGPQGTTRKKKVNNYELTKSSHNKINGTRYRQRVSNRNVSALYAYIRLIILLVMIVLVAIL